ncbi:FAD/NAD(P)-binding domain-containing protein [Whalleya microplaca]|nr:FAD/NAD(P)-binding domain-containing protein [Whalleya microplaca]
MRPRPLLFQAFRTLKFLKLRSQPGSTRSARSTHIRTMGSLPTGAEAGPFDVKNVAIIGAGPSGLAAAKYLLAEGAISRIDIFEQQAEVGGVWNYSAQALPQNKLEVPQTSAHPKPDVPVRDPEDPAAPPLFPSPMYNDLNTNIPHTLMRFSDTPFPDGCEIFPTRQVVQDYLVRYAQDVRHLIRFSTQVTGVSLRSAPGAAPASPTREQWDVQTTDLLSGAQTEAVYDAVVVASGHYATPYIPSDISGLTAFHAAHPGAISHSKLYRSPEAFRGKKVIVVGAGPSGLDIASQIRRVSAQPLLISAQSAAPPEMIAHIGVEQVPEIARFLPASRGVEFRPYDDDGPRDEPRVETGVDAVLFCTGFLFAFPFVAEGTLEPPLVTDGRKVLGIARHLLHVRHPTLAFAGLPIKAIPFPVAEAQAAVAARLWANRLPLPGRELLEKWEREDETEGSHVFAQLADGRYINEMHDWALQATGGKEQGKKPPFWDPELLWERSIYAEAKMQFEKTGKKAKTLEELGFRFEPAEVHTIEDAAKEDPQADVTGL